MNDDRPARDDEARAATGSLTRRRLLGAATAGSLAICGASALTAGTAAGQRTFPSGARVRLKPVATGLNRALAFVVADDGCDRAFVVQQNGVVRTIDPDQGGVTGTFIDIGDRIVSGGERGLLGMAFHPNFGSNRRFYLHYSAPSRSGTPPNFDHTEVLSEFQATADGSQDRPGTEQTLLEIPHPQSNHNAGTITFGPDGLLYMGMGDGGGSGDNGQDITSNLLGSILRLDVDGREDGKEYAIPDNNPRVGKSGLDEHYAWGFRNPFKFSFDSQGQLFVGDVGQSSYEEINLVEKGGNYGWNVQEGRHCFNQNGCPDQVASGPRAGEPLRKPIVEYPRSVGQSVTGGYVYEGDTIGALTGKYVFGDFVSRRLFAARQLDTGAWTANELVVAGTGDGTAPGSIRGFGRDASGELYLVTGSAVLKIVPDIEARDPDGDDLYENVDGENGVDIVDVQRLFARRDDDAIETNSGAFDFTDDGDVDVIDVQRLFAEEVR